MAGRDHHPNLQAHFYVWSHARDRPIDNCLKCALSRNWSGLPVPDQKYVLSKTSDTIGLTFHISGTRVRHLTATKKRNRVWSAKKWSDCATPPVFLILSHRMVEVIIIGLKSKWIHLLNRAYFSIEAPVVIFALALSSETLTTSRLGCTSSFERWYLGFVPD